MPYFIRNINKLSKNLSQMQKQHNYLRSSSSYQPSCCRIKCDCGARVKETGRSAEVLVYTRNGSSVAKHLEYR